MEAKKTYGKTASGEPITEDLIEELARKAELGYEVEETLKTETPAGGNYDPEAMPMTEEALIEEAGSRLAAAAPDADIILFGSRARGDARPDSDLDLLVIEPDFGRRGEEYGRLRKELRGLDVAIDLVIYRKREAEKWGSVPGSFLHRALEEGYVLADSFVSCTDTRYTRPVVKDADIYVLAGLLAQHEQWSYRSLAERLRVPHPVVQRALARAKGADLYSAGRREVHLPHFEEFAVHALRFVAPAQLGALVPGVPAAWAAEPMASAIRSSGEEPPPVWPHAQGRVRGQAIEPLHPAAPEAVEDWPELGELLALLDSLRAGDARVRKVAGDLLSERLRFLISVSGR